MPDDERERLLKEIEEARTASRFFATLAAFLTALWIVTILAYVAWGLFW